MATAAPAPKKRRGRPPKQHQAVTSTAAATTTTATTTSAPHRTPQSGNLSSASTSSQAKGPTLTAKKLPKTTAARKRENSSHSSSSNAAMPAKKVNSNAATTAAMATLATTTKQPSAPKAAAAANSSSSDDDDDDSSSSSSASYSKSSSSSSDTEAAKRGEQGPNRRIVNLNRGAKQPPVYPSSSSSSSSSEEDGDDDDEDAAPTVAADAAPHHQSPYKAASAAAAATATTLPSSCHSQLSTSESSSTSSSSDDEQQRDHREKKRKSDKNKINTLTRIFNPKEGGAKKQGQVVIIDQSEEQLQAKEPPCPALPASVAPPKSSPRLTPGGQLRVKTPARTPPTRTPTPTTTMAAQTMAGITASPARTTTPHLTSLICKIDLSKLGRVAPEWHHNNYRLYTRISTPAYDHETILNADMQACSNQAQATAAAAAAAHLRLKTPNDRSHSREILHDVGQLQNGHLSSRSADGACTPKELASYPAHLTPNGYASASVASALATRSPAALKLIKHEHGVKYEPELDAGYEAKFKPSVKQEFMLKASPQAGSLVGAGGDTKPARRRKRSSSSSSSPYKEKKRKREKLLSAETKAGGGDLIVTATAKEVMQSLPLLPTNHERLSLDKIQLLQEAKGAAGAALMPAASGGAASQKLLALSPVPPLPATCSEAVQTTPPQLQAASLPPVPAATRIIYRSYFDREEEPLNDDAKNNHFLQEAIKRKHAADLERDSFNQVTLYLEAVVYFLLTGAVMERCSSETATWTMYKDTLSLIKFISSKFRPYPQSTNGQQETHNKVAILSLRCQSLISLKLYKLRRVNCRTIINSCTEFFRSGRGEIVNGNTPSSISPSNSVGSQGSGSNTPPGKIVPQDIHNQLCKQNEYFAYVNSAHELWDQADRLVRNGNHIDFFRELDHDNGPLTLHSTMHEVFRYVQAGLKTLRDAVSHPHTHPHGQQTQ